MTRSDPLSRRAFLARTLGAGAVGLVACHGAPFAVFSAEEPAMKSPWQIGCYTRPWAQQDYRVALDAIAEAGFKYAGLMTAKAKGGLVISAATPIEEAQQVGEEAKKRRLGIPSVYGGDIPVAKSLEAGIEGLRKLIDNCIAVGAGNLMMGGTGDAKLEETYYKAIAECCDYAASKKLGLSVKPHGGLNSTGPQCRRIIERVGHKNFGLWYDPGNIFYYSDGRLDPVADAATVDGLVVGMSVKDYLPPKNVDVTPGTGKVDFRAVLARLKKGGFAGGPLVIETLAPGDLAKTLDEARKALKFVQEVVAQAGT
jgi:sugar phosphate isomerase/epimerase